MEPSRRHTMKTILLSALLVVLVPAEFLLWNFLAPFFWEPDIVGTNLAWGHPLLAFVLFSIPLGILGEILDSDD